MVVECRATKRTEMSVNRWIVKIEAEAKKAGQENCEIIA